MTQQMFGFGCDEVRKVAFEFRRGELPPEDHKRVELHLESCEACTDYVARIDGMLTATKQHDFARDLDRDAIFGQIMARMEPEEPASENVVSLQQFSNPVPDEPPVAVNDNRWRTAITGVAMLAAGILIGVLVAPLLTQTTQELPKEVAKKEQQPEEKPKQKTAPKQAPLLLADLAHQPSPDSAKNVTVYGDMNAEWSVRGAVDQEMTLKAGTVLVEFVPKHRDAKFTVETDRFTIDVVGTVFYASKEKGVIGVVTGKVNVTTRDGEPVTLERGEEYHLGDGKKDAPLQAVNSAGLHVDVDAHEKKLAMVKAPPKPRNRKYSPEVVETPRRKLRDAAESALRNGRYAIAAEYYERMVEEFPATDPENASLRLDLARIYIRYLKQPRRAVRHLKRFTKDRPRDPATPSAIEQMCRISKQLGTTEPQCVD